MVIEAHYDAIDKNSSNLDVNFKGERLLHCGLPKATT